MLGFVRHGKKRFTLHQSPFSHIIVAQTPLRRSDGWCGRSLPGGSFVLPQAMHILTSLNSTSFRPCPEPWLSGGTNSQSRVQARIPLCVDGVARDESCRQHIPQCATEPPQCMSVDRSGILESLALEPGLLDRRLNLGRRGTTRFSGTGQQRSLTAAQWKG